MPALRSFQNQKRNRSLVVEESMTELKFYYEGKVFGNKYPPSYFLEMLLYMAVENLWNILTTSRLR